MPIKDICPCPYVPCKWHNNCRACMAHSRRMRDLPNCMEPIATGFGAQLPKRWPPTLLCANSAGVAAASAADLKSILAEKPHALICLPAGGSALETFKLLIEWSKNANIDFSKARFVQLDEWVGLPAGVENCADFMDKNFYGPAGIDASRICKMNPGAADLQAECRRIDAFINEHGPIDWMLLGLGMNGHLALNEPGVSWYQYTTVVELDDVTKEVGQKYFANPVSLTRGMTIGMRHIFNAARVVLQVSGAPKADIVARLYDTLPVETMPGTVMKLLDNSLVILDENAASKLAPDAIAAMNKN